ncbi:MAG: hypothetical protein RBT25_06025, partial [Lentisphaeria bacterium]|nr:hypothetical protein [Lentisphaeria bacterium]
FPSTILFSEALEINASTFFFQKTPGESTSICHYFNTVESRQPGTVSLPAQNTLILYFFASRICNPWRR